MNMNNEFDNNNHNNNNDDDLDDFDALIYRSTPGAPITKSMDENTRMPSSSPTPSVSPSVSRTSSYMSRSKGSHLSHSRSHSKTMSMSHSQSRSPMSIRKNTANTNIKTSSTHPSSPLTLTSPITSSPSITKKIPPKLVLKFFLHEEVSSIQEMKTTSNNLDAISCHVNIEGMIHAQILSSDAKQNPPFAIRLSDPDYPEDNYQLNLNTNFMTFYGSGEFNTLTIPKAVLGQIQVASYQRSVTKKFMPILVQSKVVRTGPNLEKCLLAIQIRSNLKNKGNLKDLVICCAVPPTVISKSLRITTGEGVYDEFKRMIRWNVKELPIGNSLVFGAEVKINMGSTGVGAGVGAGTGAMPNNGNGNNMNMSTSSSSMRNNNPNNNSNNNGSTQGDNLHIDELPKFPVLIRCRSTSDNVSSVDVEIREIDGHPATIVPLKHHSFRLLHRLPS